VPAIAVPAFALTWWAACYLIGRDPARPVLWRAAAALITYAVGVAVWTVAPGTTAQILLCVPALLWAGTAVALLPESLPERRQIDLGWLVLSVLFLVMVIALPAAGRLVVLAPLVGGLVLLGRFRDQVEPPMLPAALATAAFLYGGGLVVLLLPIDVGAPGLVLAAIGVDLLILGFLVAVADALDAGERLRPDLIRSWAAALAGTVLAGGPVALTMLAADRPVVAVLQFVLIAVVMTAIGLSDLIRRGLDRAAFLHDERLRDDRSALLLLATALPRHRERHRLIVTGEQDFLRFTRRALDNYGDLGRLMRSPLTDLPAVDRRLTGRAIEQPLARAMELRAVLQESVDRLRPPGPPATTDEWRHYNALHYCSVLGLRPYERRPRTDGLDRETRRAVDWIRRYVPRRRLRRWQEEASALVARHLWEDLVSSDPRWLTRVPAGKRSATTRST
jgi:hypothetical protein